MILGQEVSALLVLEIKTVPFLDKKAIPFPDHFIALRRGINSREIFCKTNHPFEGDRSLLSKKKVSFLIFL